MFDNFVENLVEKSQNVIKAEEGDYIEDGLLYCGKCHTKKQTRIELFGTVRTPMCLCRCAVEKREAEEAMRKQIEFEQKIERYRVLGFADAQMQEWNFENDDMANERITNAMRKYVDNFDKLREDGKGLLLYGECGTGKTYAACEVANALIDKGHPVLVTNFPRIINTLQANFDGRQEYIDSLNRFSLVIIDDLGVERKSEFVQEIVYNIIDSRYRCGLPMILTTNLSMKEIKSPTSIENNRIYDRILEKCFPIEFEGRSRRLKTAGDDYFAMKDMLGL